MTKQVSAVQRRPVVGESVLINHGSDGNGKFVGTPQDTAPITAVYMDGSIRVGSGDVYDVVPTNKKGASWATRRPKNVEK